MPEIEEVAPTYDAKGSHHLDRYKIDHAKSLSHNAQYWNKRATDLLTWEHYPFDQNNCDGIMTGGFEHGDVTWFAGARMNICYNAVDRHVKDPTKANQVAMIWEGDEPGQSIEFTYADLQREISKVANAMKSQGVKKGDVVTIYMPMIPQLPMTMLAAARIGAIHSVVFAGFSSEALSSRIAASNSNVVITADVGVRGTKEIKLKKIVDEAIEKNNCNDIVSKVLVYERSRSIGDSTTEEESTNDMDWVSGRDVNMNDLLQKQRPYCPPESMHAEDPSFILYTSGSTGMPKGLVHSTAGYALYAASTYQITFDHQPGDIFACVADCGWITGHTYVVYGPLLSGGTTVIFESTPLYPDAGRYWDMVERHKISVFYTAPTAVRSLIRFGDDVPKKYDLSSLRILGSVGEPINPAAWNWYYDAVGNKQCTIVDTYWQTETGGHIVTNIPGVTPQKPGSIGTALYGIDTVVLDPMTGEIVEGNDVSGVFAIRSPWPGMARTCLGDHERYLDTYFKPYPGYYFTGDAVYRDKDGFYFITGRVDDVLNVSGHRIGTAEVESALVKHPSIAQAAVVGRPHPIKGEAIIAFATLTESNAEEEDELVKELRMLVRGEIGPFAAPDIIALTPALPMTRSGKIMRRVLRKISAGEADQLGDVSTLADPGVVDTLIDLVAAADAK
jgi:acetyl-CoA synthetase